MADVIYSCWNCTATAVYPANKTFVKCQACDAVLSRPQSEGDSLGWLEEAKRQRAAFNFKAAAGNYMQVLGRCPNEHEAHWGLVLCRYGVEVVSDPSTRQRKAIFHLPVPLNTPVTEDANYLAACEKAPREVAEEYGAMAAYIDSVRLKLTAPGVQREPVDVFLCYKSGGSEQKYAKMLYDRLVDKKYRVFYAEATLQRDAGGEQIEAEIHHALFSSRVMLLICADPANLKSLWVRSEWRRYLRRIDARDKCSMIPLFFDGCDPYALPEELRDRGIQGLKMYGEQALDAMDLLYRNLNRCLGQHAASPTADADALRRMRRISDYMEEGDWQSALEQVNRLLDDHADYARGHLYKLLIKLRLHTPEELRTCEQPFETELDWKHALRDASEQEKAEWLAILEASQALRAKRQQEREEAARRQQEEEDSWRRLTTQARAALLAEFWDEAIAVADRMIGQRPQDPMGYMFVLTAWYQLEQPSDFAGLAEPFERNEMWKDAYNRANAEERARMNAWLSQSKQLRAQKAEQARLVREAEAARQAQEAAAAAAQAEAERRAAEAEAARQAQAAAEQARRAAIAEAERRAQAEAQRVLTEQISEVRSLVANSAWQQASDMLRGMRSFPDKRLLELMAKCNISSEAALGKARVELFDDPLWQQALGDVAPQRRAQLEAYQAQALARHKSRSEKSIIAAFVLPLILLYGAAAIYLIPTGLGMIILAAGALILTNLVYFRSRKDASCMSLYALVILDVVGAIIIVRAGYMDMDAGAARAMLVLACKFYTLFMLGIDWCDKKYHLLPSIWHAVVGFIFMGMQFLATGEAAMTEAEQAFLPTLMSPGVFNAIVLIPPALIAIATGMMRLRDHRRDKHIA